MQWDPKDIGRFGFKVGREFEMAWFPLWRRDDHYDMVIFVMAGDEEPINSTTPVSFEFGDAIIRDAYDNGGLSSWDEAYNDPDATDAALTWSLDIAHKDESLLFISHGKGLLPPAEQFKQVLDAVRKGAPGFGACFEEIAALG